jgi:hypothetical protein
VYIALSAVLVGLIDGGCTTDRKPDTLPREGGVSQPSGIEETRDPHNGSWNTLKDPRLDA